MLELTRVLYVLLREAQNNKNLKHVELARKCYICPVSINQDEWNITM